jgi:hypothetical protein
VSTRGESWFQPALYAAAWLALLGLALWLPSFWQSTAMDVAVYWEAGSRMRVGGAEVYEPPTDPENWVGLYIYPPFFAAIFAPLTWLPRPVGYAVWAALQWMLAVYAFYFIGRMATATANANHSGDPGTTPRLTKLGAFVNPRAQLPLLVATFGAIWINFIEGQVNLLLVVFLASGLWQLEQGRSFRGGLLLAAAAHLKVIPIVLIAVLAVQRRFKACAAMTLGCAVLWLVPLVWTVPAEGVHGLERNVALTGQYIARIVSPRVESQSPDDVGGVRAPNNSLGAVANRWFGEGHDLSLFTDDVSPLAFAWPEWLVKWAGFAAGFLLFIAALVFTAKRRHSAEARNTAAGLALIAAALGNLLFWPHHLSLLLVALGPLAFMPEYRRRTWLIAVSVAALCFVPLLDAGYLLWLQIWGVPTACIVVVFGVLWWTFWKRAPILAAHEKANTRDFVA